MRYQPSRFYKIIYQPKDWQHPVAPSGHAPFVQRVIFASKRQRRALFTGFAGHDYEGIFT